MRWQEAAGNRQHQPAAEGRFASTGSTRYVERFLTEAVQEKIVALFAAELGHALVALVIHLPGGDRRNVDLVGHLLCLPPLMSGSE